MQDPDNEKLTFTSHSIERPCLDHLHGDPSKPDEPDGHALTVSSYLITASKGNNTNNNNKNNGNGQGSAFNFNAPSSSSSPPAPPQSQPACGMVCQDVPTAVMDNLLSLSGELVDSDHEVTPVQAWHYIRSRPQFGGLEVGVLGRFAGKLRDAVKCHGCVFAALSPLRFWVFIFRPTTTLLLPPFLFFLIYLAC